MMRPKRDEPSADAAAVDALFAGGPADETAEEAPPMDPEMGPGEGDELEDPDAPPEEMPETDEDPPQDPEVLVASMKSTIDELERALAGR